MIPPEDVLADLPSPLDDEPPSVRQDIADELADHLACAYRRELLKTADERTAQQRVLDRFGNPQRIAYQLWFQALWGRIMLSRFARVWQGLKIVAGLAALFLVFRMAEQQSVLNTQLQFMTASYNSMQSQTMGNRMLLEQLLARLPAAPQSSEDTGIPGAMGMMPSTAEGGGGGSMAMASNPLPGGNAPTAAAAQPGLTLRLTMEGDDNKPAVGCLVALVDEEAKSLPAYFLNVARPGAADMMAAGSMTSVMSMPGGIGVPGGKALRQRVSNTQVIGVALLPWHQGDIHFQTTEPGRYTVYVEFDDGLQCAHRFVIPPDSMLKSHVEHIRCPLPDKKAYVVFHTPTLPKDIVEAGLFLQVTLSREPQTIDKVVWKSAATSEGWKLDSDPLSGTPMRYGFLRTGRNVKNDWIGLLPTTTNLSDLAPSERFLTMATGKYRVQLSWRRQLHDDMLDQQSYGDFPAAGAARDGLLEISAETRDVLLDLPEGMLEAGRAWLSPAFNTPTPTEPLKVEPNSSR